MAKSKILKELANNEITLEVALNRLLIIANDIDNPQLAAWVENELNGYGDIESLPEYRKIHAPHLIYSGINGSFQVKNQPLPLGYLSESTREKMNPVCICEGISAVLDAAHSPLNQKFSRDLTFLAGEVFQKTHIQCVEIEQLITVQHYRDIESKLKSKLLKIFIELDKMYGSLDDLDVSTADKDAAQVIKVNQLILKIIDKSITMGDNNKIDKSTIKTGDGES